MTNDQFSIVCLAEIIAQQLPPLFKVVKGVSLALCVLCGLNTINRKEHIERKGKPIKDLQQLREQIRQISYEIWSQDAARRKSKPAFLASALFALCAFFAV